MQASRVFIVSCMLGMGCTDEPTTVGGDGTISGMVGSQPFDVVADSYRIGAPDDPQRTIVVYLFDSPVDCSDLGSPGWDERIGMVQSLELKTIGKTVGDYTVVGGPSLTDGDASVNWTLASSAPQEISATDGTVTLTAVDGDARGEFELSFPGGGTLTGSFHAVDCPGGHEP